MPSQEEIEAQQELLAAHRRTLAQLLSQRASFSVGYVPAHLDNGIQDARDNIARIKGILRAWGVTVEDHPDDVDRTGSTLTSSATSPLGERRFTHKEINDVADQLWAKHRELQANFLPMDILIPELDILFDSKTFRFEPLDKCVDQAWPQRLHYAFQVQHVLDAYRRNVRDRGSREQFRLYRQLTDEVSGYSMNMGAHLFEAVVVQSDVEKHIGSQEFYERVPRKRIFPFEGVDVKFPPEIFSACDGQRKSSIKVMDKLSETVR